MGAGWGEKDTDGKAHAIVVSNLETSLNVTFECVEGSTCGKQKHTEAMLDPCFGAASTRGDEYNRNATVPCVQGSVMEPDDDSLTLIKGNYTITLSDMDKNTIIQYQVEVGTGAGYTYVLTGDISDPVLSTQEDINENDVSLLLIIPQFFVITVAEVLISITGLEFAYTQAPPSMKSVLTSFWLLCTSVGNMIVIFVAEAKFMPTQFGEYLLFAA